jgi:hypothetical protein
MSCSCVVGSSLFLVWLFMNFNKNQISLWNVMFLCGWFFIISCLVVHEFQQKSDFT